MPENTRMPFIFFLVITFSSNNAFSQSDKYPLVHKEEFHQSIFENDQLRVLNVRASNGDTTALHRHCNPILYLTLQGVTVSLEEPAQPWKNVKLPTGWIGQDIYKSDSCFVHRFAIPEEGRLHIVAVEALKNTDAISFSSDPIHNENGFSVYKIELAQLAEVARLSIPIILVESSCDEECSVEVVSSNMLSKRKLQKHTAYAVFFKMIDVKF
ncbi:hypothetical protein O3Q51_08405 [Cryomorphaceae bacterium 1068]|nr:hypothetical protein [Cryomorphaceae bacterium 1068]